MFEQKPARHLASVLLLAALAAGCAVHVRPAAVAVKPAGKAVVIATGHHHSAHCGHYRHEGRWYYLRGHVHRAQCGHVRVRGVWLMQR